MKQTPLKNKKSNLKKTPLKPNLKGLKVSSSLKNKGFLLKINSNGLLTKTELKKQNNKSKARWEKVRNQVLERDNYKCVVCGKPATQVHHIHLRSKRKDLMYEINNLVSLCDKHHSHQSTEGLEQVNRCIAEVKHMTIEELLKFAGIREDENV